MAWHLTNTLYGGFLSISLPPIMAMMYGHYPLVCNSSDVVLTSWMFFMMWNLTVHLDRLILSHGLFDLTWVWLRTWDLTWTSTERGWLDVQLQLVDKWLPWQMALNKIIQHDNLDISHWTKNITQPVHCKIKLVKTCDKWLTAMKACNAK